MPGETIDFHITGSYSLGEIEFAADIGTLHRHGDGHWRWTAPAAPGSFGLLRIRDAEAPGRYIDLSAFVLVPSVAMKNGYVGNFRIDPYPNGGPPHAIGKYSPPAGFVEVTLQNRDLNVSPRFRIGQFVSKQDGGWPKYVAPGPLLYAKLELLLDEVRAAGFKAETLHVMSGYRTPYYNRTIGNVTFSRHIYGDAADVFVDIDEDGYMDDLNRDGIVNVDDAATMAGWLEGLTRQPSYAAFVGGLGVYDANQFHGPFIHLDSRGHLARWGQWPVATNSGN